MRKSTDPGGWHTPTPGSVRASPGAYAVEPAQDEIPTRPENVDADTLTLVRVFGDLSGPDRHRCVSLVRAWATCALDRRVLIEALARELAEKDTHV